MEKLILFYHTAADIPAPHCFSVKANILVSNNASFQVAVEQIFTDRDEIPKEEIEAEGFSLNDDFIWEGNLPGIWSENIQFLLKKTDFKTGQGERVTIQKGLAEEVQKPMDEGDWVRFSEELIQACLEQSGREQAMELVLGRLEKNNFFEQARVIWLFPERMAIAEILKGEKKEFKGLEWTDSQKEIQTWIEMEADSEDLYQLPKRKGWFWLLNGEIWLPFQKDQKGKIWNWLLEKVKMD
jgi:hypothetical protein